MLKEALQIKGNIENFSRYKVIAKQSFGVKSSNLYRLPKINKSKKIQDAMKSILNLFEISPQRPTSIFHELDDQISVLTSLKNSTQLQEINFVLKVDTKQYLSLSLHLLLVCMHILHILPDSTCMYRYIYDAKFICLFLFIIYHVLDFLFNTFFSTPDNLFICT